jgi:hypothetical protein
LGDAHFLEPKFVELHTHTSLKGQRVTFWRPFGRQPFLGVRKLYFDLLFRPPGQHCRTPPRGRRNPAHNIPAISSSLFNLFTRETYDNFLNDFESQNSQLNCSFTREESLLREHLELGDTFTEFFENFPSANNWLHPPIDPSFTFPGLGAGYSQPNFGHCNLQFPVAPDNPASAELAPGATFSDLPSLPPQNPVLDATLNPQLLLTIGDVQLQGEESVVGSSNPTPSSPPGASPSCLSTTIRCAWPSCEKDFKSRSDYKYVESSPFESPIELS